MCGIGPISNYDYWKLASPYGDEREPDYLEDDVLDEEEENADNEYDD